LALILVRRQLRTLLGGTLPLDWSAWLQELEPALAYGSRRHNWQARTTLKQLQRELIHLDSIDPALTDVLMAAELATCLDDFELDGASDSSPGWGLEEWQDSAKLSV
jgi:hypothetical protein